METYPLDIAPEQVLAWLIDEEPHTWHVLVASHSVIYRRRNPPSSAKEVGRRGKGGINSGDQGRLA